MRRAKRKSSVKGWPVGYLDPCGGGTLYVRAAQMDGIIKRHKFTGQAWKYKNMWKTYRPGGSVMYKSIEGINPVDEVDFWNVMRSNYLAGLPPPSSFSSIFHKVCPLPWPRQSMVSPFRTFAAGAWAEALECGTFREKIYHYDINSAYRWAACQKLPLMRTGKRIFDIEAPNSVFMVECKEEERPPWFKDDVGMMSSEELKVIPIRPRLLFGVQFRDWFDLSS